MKSMIVQCLMLFAGSILLAGCASHSQPAVTVTPNGQVMAPNPQDDVRHEKSGMSGVGPYALSKGYWVLEGGRWVWVPGPYGSNQ